MDFQGHPFDSKYLLQRPGSRTTEHLLLSIVDRLIKMFDRGKEVGDGEIKKAIKKVVRPVPQPV